MNTTLNMLASPEVTLEEKAKLFNNFKRAFYNDTITYEELEAYTELLYGTTHREFGNLPAIAPVHVPSLCEEQGIDDDVGDVGDLYGRLYNLYKQGIVGDQELPHLFPITKQNAARITAYGQLLAANIGLAAVTEAL
jgi:hypothetical protein